MTSGHFHTVPISSITVDRQGRQRVTLDDIDIMADSIRRLGLIHPIVITREGQLVAGERRLAACTSLGWTHIPVQYVDELDRATLHSIELEENVKRKDLDWKDRSHAILKYVEMRRENTPDISEEEMASALGMSQQHLSKYIGIAKELREGNELVAAAPKMSTAAGIISRSLERKAEQEYHKLAGINVEEEEPTEPGSILNTDFLTWASTYTGPKFNFIHCDFPYGIGANKFNQGAAPTHGGYTDDEETYWSLCHCLIHNLDRLCTDSCHFMFWFSMHYYHDTLELFADMADIHFDPFPLIWVKSDNVGILPDPQRGPRRIYETALFGSRGDRKVVRPTSNALYLPSDRSQHMSIKPQTVLQGFFKMFVDSSTVMLDPTCGSGSSIRAAETLGASHALGLEINKDFAEGAIIALKSDRLTRPRNVKTLSEGMDGKSGPGPDAGLDGIDEIIGSSDIV